ncbi:Glutamyl/glutaminyl-tRNA synthetase [Schizopora paradoxa]|uniref:Glutamate--tRNA ligase, mitochondrial n=1 Tax=Schizopora paradoxa TaxID=27342 RepID=A0A0H2RZU0_9AGAM|nr:Glutamyl/glutaminyl-tRNA synthetase [Schizopora paradoxa]
MVLLRFAPSPTGSLHLGGLRTALFNHLTARRLGGKWILRVEDTDAARFVSGSVEGIQRALEWAGLDYDYGPSVGGPHEPYFQSQRRDLYHTHAKSLLEKGHAYRCFCSPDRLASAHAELKARGSNATYDRHCLHLSEEEVARKVRAGERNILRLNIDNVPDRESPQDLIFGQLKDAHASLATDPVLLKSDGLPTYHLANVVDDHEMGITHVLRGEEWLPSLPLHLDLYACLNFPPPQFAHLPLLLNKDGSKLSKRHGDVSVGDYIEKGWEPGALLNWLAVTGWGTSADSKRTHKEGAVSAPDSTAIFTLQELIQEFDIKSLTRRRTILDPSKLEIINREHIKRTASTPAGRNKLQEEALRLMEKYLEVPKRTLEWGPLDADKILHSVVEVCIHLLFK